METFIKMIINISLLLGSGYCIKELLFNAEEITTKRIQRGLLSSEVYQKTNQQKATFLMI